MTEGATEGEAGVVSMGSAAAVDGMGAWLDMGAAGVPAHGSAGFVPPQCGCGGGGAAAHGLSDLGVVDTTAWAVLLRLRCREARHIEHQMMLSHTNHTTQIKRGKYLAH
eukprot:1160688-Pelagomonas_calceolata.AAC.5